MANWKYTVVLHVPRKLLGITVNEYSVGDIIYKCQTNPEFNDAGWATIGCHKMADFFDMTSGGVLEILKRLEKKGMLAFDGDNKTRKKMLPAFWKVAYLDDEGVQKLNRASSKIELGGGSKIEPKGKSSKVKLKELPLALAERNKSAFERVLEHLKDNIEERNLICAESGKVVTPEVMDAEILKWMGHNCMDNGFLEMAEYRLRYGRSSFVSWMRKYDLYTKKEGHEHGNGNNSGLRGGASAGERAAHIANESAIHGIIARDLFGNGS